MYDDIDRLTDCLAKVSNWMPYGGVDSYEIYISFGMSPKRFSLLLETALATPEARVRAGLKAVDEEWIHDEIGRVRHLAWLET